MHRNFNKIFQIGFNKCGITSIHNFFISNGLRSIQWDQSILAQKMYQNSQQNKPLLSEYEQYDCVTDMESTKHNIFMYLTHFKDLDIQYPGSKFILNKRNVDKWVKSRLNHLGYLNTYKKITGLDEQGVVNHWIDSWNAHISGVVDYFKNRPDDLVVFDIENDASKFVQFMSKLTHLKRPVFEKLNQTKGQKQ
jgi:hypothetical protein